MRRLLFLSLAFSFLGTSLLSSCQEEEYGLMSTQLSIASERPDSDGDGVPDDEDNCPSTPNPGQEDRNSDNVGDACSAEYDSHPSEKPEIGKKPDLSLDKCKEKRDCQTVPRIEFMTLRRAPRPKPCDSGICSIYIGLLINQPGFFFNPEANPIVRVIDPKSGELVDVLEHPLLDEEVGSIAFKVSEELSASFEVLQLEFSIQVQADDKPLDIEFGAIVTRESTEFL